MILALSAVLLRLVLFLGRGDYVAFDEGWYLLLGRNLLAGEGYTLNGLPHVALSPLFPILAGATGDLLGNLVWGGRVVAAVTSGLLVLPCWSIFRRLAGRRTALLACGIVAVIPSLAPFGVPFYIGWDLWVGAEPVLHFFLYSAVALYLRAWEGHRKVDWALAGVGFGLAYLARPEAIIPAGLLGLVVLGRGLRRSPLSGARALVAPVLLAVSFAGVAAPYWQYLHKATGRWQLTGRSVEIGPRPVDRAAGESPAATIERMLWDDEESDYLQNLYSLDASGTRLLSPYWGVQPDRSTFEAGGEGQAGDRRDPGVEPSVRPDAPSPVPVNAADDRGRRPLVARYLGALGTLIPGFLWPFALLGVLVPRRRYREELLVAGPIVVASLLIAVLVAIDPRTQLLIVPLATFYAARGIRLVGVLFDRLHRGVHLSRGFTGGLLAASLLVVLLATDGRRLYLSVLAGSPHHMLGSGKRVVGEALQALVPEGEPVMSWHPAIAVYAERRWCVLPFADARGIVRYARSNGCETLVVSAFHPSPWPIGDLGYEYVILELPGRDVEIDASSLGPLDDRGRYAVGTLRSLTP